MAATIAATTGMIAAAATPVASEPVTHMKVTTAEQATEQAFLSAGITARLRLTAGFWLATGLRLAAGLRCRFAALRLTTAIGM